uniref:Uncharacterized protein n=1 Tax=Tetranychus urticae TaxID=32264 RepID=A0A158P4C8_TETUR
MKKNKMQRKVYCPRHSDFKSYYLSQAGQGFSDIEIFRGSPYQRGYGFGSLFKRFAIPVLKFLGKQAVKTGINVGQDLLENKNLKQTLKERGKESLRNLAKQSIDKANVMLAQSGSGVKRKRLYKKKKKAVKRKKKDIFD